MAFETEEEAADEWTVLADSYTDALVPSFAPIYDAVAETVGENKVRVLDFGCGPGEPALTLLQKNSSVKEMIGIDSTKPMLAIAEKRAKEAKLSEKSTFLHVRRDVKMEDLKKTVEGKDVDQIVSTFVLHYVKFPRRVELVNTFLEIAPDVLFATWGKQSRVGWLRAIKTFGTWKRDTTKDICEVEVNDEDNGEDETPTGSFTMPRKENFQAIVDQAKNACMESFEVRTISITFANVKALVSFLPMSTDDSDYKAMWKLLKHWNSDQVALKETLDQELCFPTDVVFCRISRRDTSGKRPNEEDAGPESKQPKVT